MANWSLPTLTDTYTDFLTYLNDKILDSAKMFDGVTVTNPVLGMIKWNSTNKYWEKYNGTSWANLETKYMIDVDKVDGCTVDDAAAASTTVLWTSNKINTFAAGYVTTSGLSTALSGYILKGGENGTLTLGTNDTTAINLETANINRLSISGTGNAAITAPSVGVALAVTALAGQNGITSTGGGISTDNSFTSTVATGTAPLVVSSTTKVTNLNADLLDGYTVAETNTTSTVAVRDSAGDIHMRLPRIEYAGNGWNGGYLLGINSLGGAGTDNYARPTPVPTWNQNTTGNAQSATFATTASNVSGGTLSGNLIANNFGIGNVGLYSATKYQAVFAMGDSYRLPADGTTPGTLYGIAWTHSNIGGQSIAGLGHQALFMENGVTKSAIGAGVWTSGNSTASTFRTQPNANWAGTLQLGGNGDAPSVANHAIVQTTNGNLHLDSGVGMDIYLNNYSTGAIRLGHGAGYNISADGSYYTGTSANANNASLLDGLDLHTGRNNEANKVVRTNGSGYLDTGYINCTNGNENNNSNADRVWGTNGSDDYMRTYRTSALNVNSSTFMRSDVTGTSCLTVFQNTPAGQTSTKECNAWADAPNTGWWIIHSLRHANASNLWGTQIAYGWEDNQNAIYQRNVSAGTWSGWTRVDVSSANITELVNNAGFITSSGSISGNAGTVTSSPNRTDTNAYPVVWNTSGGTSQNYSCAGVTITSSTGTLTATNIVSTASNTSTGTGNDYNNGAFQALGNGSANTLFPTIGFHQPGLYASSLQLRGSSDFRFYAQGATNYANVTASQFTSGVATGTAPLVVTSTTKVTNLNADLLDGLNTATSASGSTIVARDVNGSMYGYFINSSRANETSAAASYIYDTGDGWMRKKTLANVQAEIGTSLALSGTPTAPTAAVGTSTTQVATTAFVNAEIVSTLVASGTVTQTITTGTTVVIDTGINAGTTFQTTANNHKYVLAVGTNGGSVTTYPFRSRMDIYPAVIGGLNNGTASIYDEGDLMYRVIFTTIQGGGSFTSMNWALYKTE